MLKQMFAPGFMPHGHCYLWTPEIMWGHAISDAVIALSYYSIPMVLILVVRRRNDLEFGWVFLLFAMFILACGTGHAVDIWNIWHGDYGLSTLVRIVTAFASIATAVALWPLLPRVLQIPSTQQMQSEIAERRRAEEGLRQARDGLERRVEERTHELAEFSRLAVDREDQMVALKQRVNELCAELGRAPEFDLSFLDVADGAHG